ncbi:hypothetical protein [Streptomyces sp. NPDC059168]|uniref:hypothetical protein n=1 Tax=Streptomyces sp. NPDC059168 TaxID=3346753 RepID=UPI0036B2CB48
MYHHFPLRDDVIAAVYESEAAAAIARAADRMPEGATGYERLIAGCLAWLDEVSRPGARLILIEDGPAVLGWRRCRQIEDRYSLERIRGELQRASGSGETSPASIKVTARLVSALLGEAALIMIDADDQTRVRAEIEAALRALLSNPSSPSRT